jgi:hypothetical protein
VVEMSEKSCEKFLFFPLLPSLLLYEASILPFLSLDLVCVKKERFFSTHLVLEYEGTIYDGDFVFSFGIYETK